MEIQYDQPEQTFVGIWIATVGVLGLVIWLAFGHGEKPFLAILMALLFLATGVALVIMRADQHASLSQAGPVTVTTTRKFGGRITTKTIQHSDITSVQYYPFTTEYFDRGSNVYLVLKDNSKFKLNSQRLFHIPFSSKPAGPLEDQARQIAAFLSVPLTYPEPGKLEPLDR